MKEGDKVVCINPRTYTDDNGNKYIYKTNNNYEIGVITRTHIGVICDNKCIGFYTPECPGSDADLFYNIFIPLKEQRKLKLKKINGKCNL